MPELTIKIGKLTYPGTVTFGDLITISVPVKNTSKVRSDVVFYASGLDDQTFTGCRPACDVEGSFSELAAPAPGKTITYKLIWQAVRPGSFDVYVALDHTDLVTPYAHWSFRVTVLV